MLLTEIETESGKVTENAPSLDAQGAKGLCTTNSVLLSSV